MMKLLRKDTGDLETGVLGQAIIVFAIADCRRHDGEPEPFMTGLS
ncbi:MAG: hypothetical protein V3W44_00160 [Dehalococcoidales bacterium]